MTVMIIGALHQCGLADWTGNSKPLRFPIRNHWHFVSVKDLLLFKGKIRHLVNRFRLNESGKYIYFCQKFALLEASFLLESHLNVRKLTICVSARLCVRESSNRDRDSDCDFKNVNVTTHRSSQVNWKSIDRSFSFCFSIRFERLRI